MPTPTRIDLAGGWYFKRFPGGWFLLPPDGKMLPCGDVPWPFEAIESFVMRLEGANCVPDAHRRNPPQNDNAPRGGYPENELNTA